MTDEEKGLIRDPAFNQADQRHAEQNRQFFDSLPLDLQQQLGLLMGKLTGKLEDNSWLGLRWDLLLTRNKIMSVVDDGYTQAQLLQLLAMIEPFVALKEAEDAGADLEQAVKEKKYHNPDNSITKMLEAIGEVKKALSSDRPYDDMVRKDIEQRCRKLENIIETNKGPAFINYLDHSVQSLENYLSSNLNRPSDIEDVLAKLTILQEQQINLPTERVAEIKKLVNRAYRALVDRMKKLKINLQEHPMLQSQDEND